MVYTGAYGSGSGFYLGTDGRFSLGGALTWNGSQLSIRGGATFSGTLQAATGTFSGALQAATGTFAGTLSANAVDVVDTLNIRGNAVTVPASGVGSAGQLPQCTIYMPQPGAVYVTANLWVYENNGSNGGAVLSAFLMQINSSTAGAGGYCLMHTARARHATCTTAARFNVPAGYTTFSVGFGIPEASSSYQIFSGTIMALGTMR
jgi:hypothetical protein